MKQCRRIDAVLGSLVVAVALTACSSGSDATKPTSTTRRPRTTTTTTTTPPRPEGWSSVTNAPTALGKYAVWTGTEYIGGPAGCCDDLGGTAVVAYAPSSNTWRFLAAFPLLPRAFEVAAWTGHEMVVVGGRQAASATDATQTSSLPTATGAALDPTANTWRTIAPMPAPMASPLGAVWTGEEVVVFDHTHTYRYRPKNDHWSVGAAPPFARDGSVVVWTGHQMLVWAGRDPEPENGSSPPLVVHADGASYDPASDTWHEIPAAPVPARTASMGVWTGHRMIVWGGFIPSSSPDPLAGYPRDGAAYNPATNRWRSLPAAPASPPALLTAYSAVWTGDQALFLGGESFNAQGVGPLGLAYAPGP